MAMITRTLGFAGVGRSATTQALYVVASRTTPRLITFARFGLATPSATRGFGSAGGSANSKKEELSLVVVDYHELCQMTPKVLQQLREAFVGPKAIGSVAVANIPGYGDKLTKAFRAGINLALTDPEGRQRAAAVNNTYPGWSGVPGSETHPLQSSFLFNTKEVIPGGKVNPYFGKSIFPSPEYKETFVDLVTPMHNAALEVLRGCDMVIEEELKREGMSWSDTGRSLYRLGVEGPALASRFICYDSGFTREDSLLHSYNGPPVPKPLTVQMSDHPGHSTVAKLAGHAADGLASMRTHSTPVKSAGHAGDGLASMRTHSTPVKSAGHAGDGLASMRTHSTPVKSAGHAGDGLASMRTHSTPVKSAGHAGDGLASMRTHSTPVKSAGHAGDGLASMRTHSTPVKSAGHAGDGLASMQTHSTPVKSAGHAGDGLASMRTHSTPVKSAGHAGDGLASMRTHSTPVKSAGHAGDGLASMRTHSTPVKSAGHAGDGLASMRTHSTPVKSAGHAGGGSSSSSIEGMQSMRTSTTPTKAFGMTAGAAARPLGDSKHTVRPHSTQTTAALASDPSLPVMPLVQTELQVEDAVAKIDDVGEYWLPWHIDSNFVTVLHKERYASEVTAEFVQEPEGAGLKVMNPAGDIAKMVCPDDVMVVQIGAFGQIYAGGVVNACRHAVVSPRPPGVARFNFCNFWYVPWHTLCDAPAGRVDKAVSDGWNAMMDSSYLDITMRQGFAAFRKFMTSPEARVQFADSVRFKELSEMIPLPPRRMRPAAAVLGNSELVVDVLTDVRCPFSFLSQLNLEQAMANLGLNDRATVRYHPVFLNPHVPKEGESLDDYLLREYGYTKEYAHSENYPLRVEGLKAGVLLNPHRRVVNTFNAFVMIDAATEMGKQHEFVKALSQRYFVQAEDISDERVLAAAAADAGLPASEVAGWLTDLRRRARVQARYEELSAKLGEVPHFVLRDKSSGNGLEIGGHRSVEAWEEVLQGVLEKARFIGVEIPGPYGTQVRLVDGNPNAPASLALGAQHGWASPSWPYTDADFSRIDESSDADMYSEPRLVNHLDDSSLVRLTEVYRSAFSSVPPGFAVLDLCSSWISHFPLELVRGARVAVHGLNSAELNVNALATERHVQDLNLSARLPWDDQSFDFVTMALSVQYLTDPRAVFAEMHRVLKPGGMAIITHSHRCFIEKAVKLFATETDAGEDHTHHVCNYFRFGPAGGWERMSTVDVSPNHGDPVWVVTAVKAGFSD